MTISLYPTAELIVQAWLGQRVPELVPAQVAGSLPADPTSWTPLTAGSKSYGFVTAVAIPGAKPQVDYPVRHTVCRVDFWGVTPESNKPAWNVAAQLCEAVRNATEATSARYSAPLQVSLPNYRGAILGAAYLLTEPRRYPDDPSGYARLSIDLQADWELSS